MLCSPSTRRPRTSTRRPFTGSGTPPCASSWPGPSCCTASGCVARSARQELAATGETIPKDGAFDAPQELTAKELHIARLAAEGLTNHGIGAELFISPRTVEWHLAKVFTKLDIATRVQLREALPASSTR